MNDLSAFTPPPSAFSQSFAVVEGDIDVLGHANNVVWVRWVQDVAVAHSDALGWDLGAYRRLGCVWVVRRHDIEYLLPGLSGDRIRARTWIGEAGRTSALRRTLFERESDSAVLARAQTTWVLIGSDGRPTRVPDEMRAAFRAAG